MGRRSKVWTAPQNRPPFNAERQRQDKGDCHSEKCRVGTLKHGNGKTSERAWLVRRYVLIVALRMVLHSRHLDRDGLIGRAVAKLHGKHAM